MEPINKNNSNEYLKRLLAEWDSDKLIRYYAEYRAIPYFQTNVFDIPQYLKHDAFYLVHMEMNKRKIDKIKAVK